MATTSAAGSATTAQLERARQLYGIAIIDIRNGNWTNVYAGTIIDLSPLSSSKKIVSARLERAFFWLCYSVGPPPSGAGRPANP
jgi:hypothetical protein